MKKSQLYDRAEQLYVEELWTFEAIAKELDCSDRTLRNWAKESRWETKRKNFKNAQERLSDDVREIALLLAEKIKGQLDNEIEPSPHVLNAFTRMASSLIRVRDYDKSVESEVGVDDSTGNKTAVDETFAQMFGVKLAQNED